MKVLFICQLNSVRSPMAEGLLRKRLGVTVDVSSCGLEPVEPNDFMLAVMKEVGVDMAGHQPMALKDLEAHDFDLVIAFTQDVYESAKAVFEKCEAVVELWSVPDPGESLLDVRALFDNYRAIRTNIDTRLERRFGPAT